MKKSNGWFYYFDEKPETQISEKRKGQLLHVRQHLKNEKDDMDTKCFTRAVTQNVPSLSITLVRSFISGYKAQLVGESLRFNPIRLCREHLSFCVLVSLEDLSDDELDSTVVDICLGSPENVCSFIDTMGKIGTLVLQVQLVM